MSRISKMRRSPVVGNLFSGRRALPRVMFTGRALAKRCAPNPVNPENPDSDNKQPLCPDNVSGGRGGRLPTLSDSRPTET